MSDSDSVTIHASVEPKKDLAAHVEQSGSKDFEQAQLVEDARRATEQEKQMGIFEAVRRYPKAICWSILLSSAIIMEGYDTTLLSQFYAMSQFTHRYGVPTGDGGYTIEAKWQSALSAGASIGEIIGLYINGWASERFGYRKTMIGALIAMTALIFMPVFAQNIQTFLAAEILQGIPWGIFQTLTTAYASEISPVALRPVLTAYVNLCWVFGQIIASGVDRGVLSWQSQWAYRLPFALQWLWPVPILIGTIFAPESPWWLVRTGRLQQARKEIARINSGATAHDVEASLALIVHTNAVEREMAESTTWMQCFSGVDRRRTEVASGVWLVQNLCGSAFMGYSTFFLEQAGLPQAQAFNLSIGQYAIGICGTVASWALMPRVGRRRLYLVGLGGMFIMLIVIGGMGFISHGDLGAQWAIGALLLVYTALYDSTVGPVCYCLVAEISSTRLRAKTIVIARIAYNVIGVVNSVIMPQFLNTDALNWGGKTGLFWGGMCGLCFIWTFFRVPEPKGRTYGELDMLFENRVSARKFAQTEVDQFVSHGAAGVNTQEAHQVEGIEVNEQALKV